MAPASGKLSSGRRASSIVSGTFSVPVFTHSAILGDGADSTQNFGRTDNFQ
ncbi:hypothetical protein SAMN04490194_4264 [Pseudomonas migulae]|uniref:Uncharacterized protein n=1 Tax=Pseudomonas migulae TaxID=78543 RepID=A0A1H5LWP9_9PSED|nr:hypothetical protein SAMN04490194_4264 [Pseudomonas migulae]